MGGSFMSSRRIYRFSAIVACLAGFWFACRKSPFTAPGSVLSPMSIPIHQTVTVQPNQEYQLTLPWPELKTPGWLRGHWTVRGKSANFPNAADDTLVGFTLTGPNNEILQRQNHPTSGNFAIRCEGGEYTMTFNNTGVLRASARIVTIDGTYQPD
jgi:hypothetical protein